MKPIIISKFETDGYKLTMGNIFWFMNLVQGRRIQGRYMFVDRDNTVYPKGHIDLLREEIGNFSTLSPDQPVADYVCQKWPFINQEFIRWYNQVFYHDSSQVDLSEKDGKLRIFVEGPIHTASHFEIPLLRSNSAIYTQEMGFEPKEDWRTIAYRNAKYLADNNVAFSEGGGRRAFSPEVHRGALLEYEKFRKTQNHGGLLGTSWVKYAYDLNLMVMGTMAHEYIELMAGLYGYQNANRMAMQTWVDHYGRRLGYFLPDTFTTDVALRDFNHFFTSTFEGTRHDSGKPYWYADKMVDHYRRIGIDMTQKSIIYSNSLGSLEEIIAANSYRLGEFRRAVLLGKFITNNVGHKAYNTVLKLISVKEGDGPWIDVVKLSDDPEKGIGKSEEAINCRNILGI